MNFCEAYRILSIGYRVHRRDWRYGDRGHLVGVENKGEVRFGSGPWGIMLVLGDSSTPWTATPEDLAADNWQQVEGEPVVSIGGGVPDLAQLLGFTVLQPELPPDVEPVEPEPESKFEPLESESKFEPEPEPEPEPDSETSLWSAPQPEPITEIGVGIEHPDEGIDFVFPIPQSAEAADILQEALTNFENLLEKTPTSEVQKSLTNFENSLESTLVPEVLEEASEDKPGTAPDAPVELGQPDPVEPGTEPEAPEPQ